MKRVFAFLCALAALFTWSCGGSSVNLDALRESCAFHAQKTGYTAKFRLNMTFENGENTLLFSQGSYDVVYENGAPRVTARASQNYLSAPSAMEGIYSGGIYRVTRPGSDGSEGEIEMAPERFFGQLTYLQPFVPDEKYIKSVKEVQTGIGAGVTLTLKDAFDLLYPTLGDGVYELAKINQPKYELAELFDAELTLVPSDEGGIASMTLVFTLRVADTPPYVPGGGDRQDLYTLDIRTEYTVSFE